MYEAKDNKVYVNQNDQQQLFLTVHPTDTGGTVTVEKQAAIIASVLNRLTPSTP